MTDNRKGEVNYEIVFNRAINTMNETDNNMIYTMAYVASEFAIGSAPFEEAKKMRNILSRVEVLSTV